MQIGEEWLKTWICLSFLFAWVRAARPRFDVSTDMGMVLVPADAEVDTVIFRLRATDQDTDFPLIFEIIATTSPIVRVENLPCTLYNKVCQANVILTRRLVAGRLHDFVVRVRDSKGDVNSMQATISVTNSTTPRDKIFPHVPSLIMVPEDTKPEKELDYLLVESNPWSGKPVYIELWQPKELFKIRQRQMGSQTKGIITLIGELDFETQSMYTLTMYATDPYTEPGKDTRNIAGLHVVVIVQDVQDVPPVFTLAPPLTKINNSIKSGDLILRVHAEDGDKGVPREVTYGLISEGNPFTPFFNVSETTGEIILVKPLEELTKITHVGAPIVLKIVAEEIRSTRDEPPAQATVVELGLLLGEPVNSPPYFENDNYIAWLNENAEPGTMINFSDDYSTRVKDEDIGKAGVFALKLENNNGTFEISPTVAERNANFVIMVRDNTFIDYEKSTTLRFKIVAQEVGPATNLSTSVPVTIFLSDVNDNNPSFDSPVYNVTLSENTNAGTRVVQVHATDKDTGDLGKIQYTKIIGDGSEAFVMNPENGVVTVSMGTVLDRELTPRLELIVEARDEDGRGLRGTATLIVNILDVNDNPPLFEKGIYEFLLNSELTNFTTPAFIKALDTDTESPNNIVQYEIVHGNYENKFQLNEITGELMVREGINKSRKVRQNNNGNLTLNMRKQLRKHVDTETLENQVNVFKSMNSTSELGFREYRPLPNFTQEDLDLQNQNRSRRAEDNNPLFILTARAYDLGVPHLSTTTQIRIIQPMSAFARIVMFVMPGENPDPRKTAETLATITGSRVIIQEIKPYISQINPSSSSDIGKRSVVVARVEQNGPGTLVDVDKIRASLTANGFGIISGMDNVGADNIASQATNDNTSISYTGRNNTKNNSIIDSTTEDTVYKAENKLLTWLLVVCGLLLLAAIITLIICCICPNCPFYMEPRKRRIHSSETLLVHSDGRPKRHLHRKPMKVADGYYAERKEAWSADPERHYWQFNRRNTKNLGIASLPGDIAPGYRNPEIERLRRAASLRLRDDVSANQIVPFAEQVLLRTRATTLAPPSERIYVEDVETVNRDYEQEELESFRRHELERGSMGVPSNEAILPGHERLREQHFYRDGNAEVLRLITRGDIEDHKNFADAAKELHHTNGKDILLQRFIADQKLRRSQDLRDSFQESFHEADVDHSTGSHQRINETTEILILPERLELPRQLHYNQGQHQRELMLKTDIQRLIAGHNYKSKDFKDNGSDEYRSRGVLKASMRDEELTSGEVTKGPDKAAYVMHDVELVRQNALLTRLLLEKEAKDLNVPIIDSSSFLETQSLPGHVAIATQTDRTTATQTEFFGRSRSDNEELEEDPRIRRKSKQKERVETKEDFKKLKTIWVRTPIPEEIRTQSGNKISTPTRTKIEVTESCKVSISPDALKEISSSLKSSESGGNDEDEDDEVLGKGTKFKPDLMQKVHKLTSKAVCLSKKKVKETKADNDSTTASPEVKEKNTLLKSKIRKKMEKTPKSKKLEKNMEFEKNNFMEPSFRILEKEISSFQKKIREFGDKKLKIIKRDSDKTDKECKSDDGPAYDLSKKCEITVKQIKKSISMESSPIKISVERKARSSEEENLIVDNKTTDENNQNNTSSDFYDFEKINKECTDLNEKVLPTTKVQRTSRSKLKKQMHLRNSDTRSECEKVDKSDDSENKIEKLKDSSSSLDMKMDSTSCSSKDFSKHKQTDAPKKQKSQSLEKKSIRNQRLSTNLLNRPSGIVEMKKKVPSLESRTIEELRKRMMKRDEKLDINKTSTSDDSKATSPSKSKLCLYHKKLNTSDENQIKLNQKVNLSTAETSTVVDFDKLVEEVNDAAEKEISLLTQVTQEIINGKKTDDTVTNNLVEKSLHTLELKEIDKIQATIMKNGQEIDISPSTDETTMLMSVKNKDSEEKINDKTEKSKLIGSISPAQVKSDDQISFIVMDKNKIASINGNELDSGKHDMLNEDSKNSKAVEQYLNKNNEKLKSNENLNASKSDIKRINTKSKEKSIQIKNMIIDKIDDTKMMESDRINENDIIISNKNDQPFQIMSDRITEKTKIMSDEIKTTEKNVIDNIDEIQKNVLNQTRDIRNTTIDKIDDIVPDIIHEIKLGEISETKKKSLPNTVNEAENSINETRKMLSHTIDKTKETVTDKVDVNKITSSDELDESKEMNTSNITENVQIISDNIAESKQTITDNVEENEKIVSHTIDTIKQTVTDKVHGNKKLISNEMDDIKKMASNKVDESVKIISNKMTDIEKIIANEIDESEKTIADKIDEYKSSVSSKIDDTVIKINNSAQENKMISDAIDESKTNLSDKIDTMKKEKANISDNMNKKERIVLDKKEELSRKIDEVKSEMSETSLEKKDDFTLKLEKEDTTMKNIVDSAVNIPNETIKKSQDIENNTGNTNLENDLLKSKSACLPNERKEEDDEEVEEENVKKSEENKNKVDQSKMNNETKESCNIMDNDKISKEPLSIVDKNIINAISKERIDNDNMNASCMVEQEEPCKEKSITALTETKETIDNKIHEEIPNKEDYISSKKSNEGNEISSLSSREMADLQGTKEFERQQKHQTGKTEFISTIVSDEARETVMKASQMKQAQHHVNVTEKKSTNSTIKCKPIGESDDRKQKSNSLNVKNKEANGYSITVYPQHANEVEKTTISLANASVSIKVDGEESDDDHSSTATDISNKTALRTKPYGTPRHSISSDDIADTSAPSFEKTSSSAKSNGKMRQKWNPEREKDPLLQVTAQQSKESFVIGFPPKTETVSVDKAKISANKAALDEAKMQKSHAKDSNTTSKLLKSVENAETKTSSSRQRTDTPKTRPVIVGVKRKNRTESRAVPSRGKIEEEAEYEKPQRQQSNWEARGKADAEQRKAVIRSRHLKLHVGHRAWQPKNEARVPEERCTSDVVAGTASPSGDSKDEGLSRRADNGREPEIAKARSRYMAWYQQKRFEMERKRRERKEVEEDQMRPRWLRPGPGTKPRKAKSAEDADQRELLIKESMGCQSRERAKSSSDVVQPTCFSRVRVRPLVNVESEQLKAIVRQGRKLRKAEGVKEAEPEVLIFAPEKPPRMDLLSAIIQHEPRHHLTQHSEYKFEKEVPAVPFYLHSPHVSQPTQELFQDNSSESRRLEEDLDSGIAVSMQSGTRLRHQQLLEKKSVFDIAYSEAAPTQLRSDSSTPPT